MRNPVNFLCAFAGLIGIWLLTERFGPGATPDSAAYLSAAESLARGEGLLSYDGRPYIHWPPLYPTALAPVIRGGAEPLQAARGVNALLFGLTLFLAGRWMIQNKIQGGWFAAGLMLLLCSTTLHLMFASALSESLFILLSLVFLFRVTRGGAMELALLVAAAAATRYVGVVLYPLAALALAANAPAGWRPRVRRVLGFSLMVGALLLPWFLRNLRLTGTLTGERGPSHTTAGAALTATADILSQFFAPAAVPFAARVVVLIAGLAGLAGLTVAALRREEGRALWPLPAFVLVYIGYLLATAPRVYFDAIDFRLLSPVFVPLALWIILVLACQEGRRWRLGAGLLLAGWLALSAQRTAKFAQQARSSGIGMYTTAVWNQSPTLRHLREQPPSGRIYSNAPDLIFIQTGRRARLLPIRGAGGPGEITPTGADSVYVVWFPGHWRKYVYGIDELTATLPLAKLQEFSDGAIYSVAAHP
jgi:hypothetical protein